MHIWRRIGEFMMEIMRKSVGDVDVKLVHLPPGHDVDHLLPPDPVCPLVSLSTAGSGSVSGDQCVCMRVVSVEDHITSHKHQVAENRVRSVLECVMSGRYLSN